MITETSDRTPRPGENGIRVRSVSHGYVWRVFTGSGRILGGWEPTEAKANERAQDAIVSL